MLKKISRILIPIIAFLMVGSIVLAATWLFRFPTNVVDTGGTTRNNLAVSLGYGANTLINSGKLTASGLDSNMQIGTTSVKYMLADNNTYAVIPSLTANGQQRLDLYTGYSPAQTSFSTVLGNGGYFTIADNPTLEMGANFQEDYSGYFPTSLSGNLVNKDFAYTLSYGSGNITATIPAVGASSWISPVSTNSSGAWANPANAYDGNTGTFATESVNIGDWTDYLAMNLASTVYSTKTRFFAAFSPNIKMEVDIFNADTLSWTNIFSNTFADSTWVDAPIGSTVRVSKVRIRMQNNTATNPATMQFNEIAVESLASVSVSSAKIDGDYLARVSYNGTDLNLYVDNLVVPVATTAWVGTVTNNANNWIVTPSPYINYYKKTVGGTLIAWYQPNSVIIGTTLPDRQGAAENGVITWGSNTNITLTYGEMESFNPTAATISQTGGFQLQNSGMPSTWFAAGENLAQLPFYDSFSNVALNIGMPTQTLYFVIAIGMCFLAFIIVAAYTRSALLGVISLDIVLFVSSSMTIVPMWIPVAILIVQLAIMFLYRQVAY